MDFYRAPTQISEVLLNVIGERHKRFCTIGDLAAGGVQSGCVFTNFCEAQARVRQGKARKGKDGER